MARARNRLIESAAAAPVALADSAIGGAIAHDSPARRLQETLRERLPQAGERAEKYPRALRVVLPFALAAGLWAGIIAATRLLLS